MSERNARLLIDDIVTAIEKIQIYTAGYTFEEYVADDKTRHAVERNFEIIGETASRVPDAYKQLHPRIEWRLIKDFKNYLIHEYFGVNAQIVWDTIRFRLNDLKIAVGALLKEED